MSLELIYTSAPRGLKPGSSGFCTVAMTQGMPPQLASKLEALSGYRQLFPPQDPQAGLNPVVHSYLRISLSGRNYHVLSRICAAGLDYSQRANKFAHHVVLDASELPPAGPAWLLAAPGFMRTAWDGTVGLLAPGRRAPPGNIAPAVCRNWQSTAGDAGWGGVLAETAADARKALVTLLFQPGLDPLPLLAESLALLPPELRWSATFSTYYTKLPPGTDCRWRSIVTGSPEATASAGLVLNLCRPLACDKASAYVTAARSGRAVVAAPTSRVPVPLGAIAPPAAKPDDAELYRLLGDPAGQPTFNNGASPMAPAEVPMMAQQLPPVLPAGFEAAELASSLPTRRFRKKEAAQWPYAVGILAIAGILIGGGVALWIALNGNSKGDRVAVLDGAKKLDESPKTTNAGPAGNEKSSNRDNNPSTASSATTRAPPPQPATANNQHRSPEPTVGATNARGNPGSAGSSTGSSSGNSPSAPPPPPPPVIPVKGPNASPPVDPFNEFRGGYLGLREYKERSAVGGTPETRSAQPLGTIHGSEPKQTKLEFVGPTALTPNIEFSLLPDKQTQSHGDAVWNCKCRVPPGDPVTVATLSIANDGSLALLWNDRVEPEQIANQMLNEVLKLASVAPAAPAFVALRYPVTIEIDRSQPPKLFSSDAHKFSIPIQARYLPAGAHFCFRVKTPFGRASDSPAIHIKALDDASAHFRWGSEPLPVHLQAVLRPIVDNDKRVTSLAVDVTYQGVDLAPSDWTDLGSKDHPIIRKERFQLTREQVTKHIWNLTNELGLDARKLKQSRGKYVAETVAENETSLTTERNKPDKDKNEKKIADLKARGTKLAHFQAAINLDDVLVDLQNSAAAIRFEVYYPVAVDKDKSVDVDVAITRASAADAAATVRK